MNKRAHWLALLGAYAQLLPVIGLVLMKLRTEDAMKRFRPNGSTDEIVSAIDGVSSEIAGAQDGFLISFGIALVGVLIFIVAISLLRYRRPWAFWFSCLYGPTLLLLTPLAFPLGLFLLIYALLHREEFRSGDVHGPATGTGQISS